MVFPFISPSGLVPSPVERQVGVTGMSKKWVNFGILCLLKSLTGREAAVQVESGLSRLTFTLSSDHSKEEGAIEDIS